MSPRLTILTGTLAGQARVLGASRTSLGRDPLCEIRFDANSDVEVSARHAEIRMEDGRAVLHDANSTNGTYVNDRRIRGDHTLVDGDVIRLGARGPKLRFESAAVSIGGGTTQRVAAAVKEQTRGLRISVAALALLAVAGAGMAAWVARRGDASRSAELELLRRRNDSLSAAIDRDMHAMSGRLAGLDSALAESKRESDRLREQLRAARSSEGVRLLSARIAEAESRRGAIAAAARMDYETIARTNGRAVVMIAVEMADGQSYSGTGFGVTADGAIVTNRHVLRADSGETAKRIAVIYADTRDWLPARIERVAGDADLALLRVEREGSYPVVSGIASAPPVVGAPVAVIGYPLGTATPMEGSGTAITARATLGVGTVSKSIADALQIDGYAVEGSSGSPVFGADGAVVGVVYGGAAESRGHMVYAVPAAAVRALLR
ncbi:MAG TPA: trypsin-like peptidase domain-containing protein [Gemmatimonadaceae bacterium]|nr:trypsin-like peptidase domain-containing protein [Gemmatimonadaceae bacterium]